jgi:hypothetical protein
MIMKYMDTSRFKGISIGLDLGKKNILRVSLEMSASKITLNKCITNILPRTTPVWPQHCPAEIAIE